jgi:hypothetical protein
MENNQNHDYLSPATEQPAEPPATPEPQALQQITGRKVIQPLNPASPPDAVPPVAPAQPASTPAPTPLPAGPIPAQETVQPVAQPAVVSGSFAFDETAAAATSAASAAPTQTYLTGSQLAEEKQSIPKGIYVLVAWNALGLITSFFDASSTGVLYTVGLLLSLLVTVGLLFRLEAMRKLYIVLSVVVALAGGFEILGLYALQARYHQAQNNYEAAVAKLDAAGRINASQKKKLTDTGKDLSAKTKSADKALTYTYAIVGTGALVNIGAAVYLTRPSVKEAFRTLEA